MVMEGVIESDGNISTACVMRNNLNGEIMCLTLRRERYHVTHFEQMHAELFLRCTGSRSVKVHWQ